VGFKGFLFLSSLLCSFICFFDADGKAGIGQKRVKISQPMFCEELAEANAYMLNCLPVIYQAGD
tara:strand:- start:322 stop:513 length:192 start_codon:yes stop_codon:yes gene_type:complete